MRFWDTSAVVPLCVAEPESEAVGRIARADPGLVVWWATRSECVSALARRRRDRALDARDEERARRVLFALAEQWSEVLPTEALRRRSERLLAVHSLRTADAFQLAAALLWSRGETTSHVVVSLDERLREAVGREGFQVEPA